MVGPTLPEEHSQVSNASLTCCLREVREGASGAEERLLNLVYQNLRRMAGQRMRRERPGHTLQPTALANEVWMKLIRSVKAADWKDSGHFYATCGRMMRNILVDYSRRRRFEQVDIELMPGIAVTEQRSEELLALDHALEKLARFDPRGAKVVELILFAGFTRAETAEVLGVGERTVKRDFAACQLWLRSELRAVPAKAAAAGA